MPYSTGGSEPRPVAFFELACRPMAETAKEFGLGIDRGRGGSPGGSHTALPLTAEAIIEVAFQEWGWNNLETTTPLVVMDPGYGYHWNILKQGFNTESYDVSSLTRTSHEDSGSIKLTPSRIIWPLPDLVGEKQMLCHARGTQVIHLVAGIH